MTSITLALIAILATPPPAAKAVEAPAAQAKTAEKAPAKTTTYGEALALKERINMDELAAKADSLNGKTVQVSGKVSAVCLKKGCWMTLAGEKAGSTARITFKNYGFFVPLDSAGSQAVVEGVVEVKTMTDAERQHLADDAGKSVDTIPKNELRLMAAGCELTR